jgi:hypothetical protein
MVPAVLDRPKISDPIVIPLKPTPAPMTPPVVRILRQAKDLIGTPERWTRYSAAIDADGNTCSITSSLAVSWCAFGAVTKIGKEADDSYRSRAILCLDAAAGRAYGSAPALNDNASHAEVMAMFDRAIEIAHERYGR